jgi:hypothetical protein
LVGTPTDNNNCRTRRAQHQARSMRDKRVRDIYRLRSGCSAELACCAGQCSAVQCSALHCSAGLGHLARRRRRCGSRCPPGSSLSRSSWRRHRARRAQERPDRTPAACSCPTRSTARLRCSHFSLRPRPSTRHPPRRPRTLRRTLLRPSHRCRSKPEDKPLALRSCRRRSTARLTCPHFLLRPGPGTGHPPRRPRTLRRTLLHPSQWCRTGRPPGAASKGPSTPAAASAGQTTRLLAHAQYALASPSVSSCAITRLGGSGRSCVAAAAGCRLDGRYLSDRHLDLKDPRIKVHPSKRPNATDRRGQQAQRPSAQLRARSPDLPRRCEIAHSIPIGLYIGFGFSRRHSPAQLAWAPSTYAYALTAYWYFI